MPKYRHQVIVTCVLDFKSSSAELDNRAALFASLRDWVDKAEKSNDPFDYFVEHHQCYEDKSK